MTNPEARVREHVQDVAARIHRWIVVSIVAIMAVEFGFAIIRGQWLNALLILIIAGLLLAPTLLGDRFSIRIPYEFQLFVMVIGFAALFLGEIRSFYYRFWWWDIVLHTASSFLLGIFGFLLVYVLNENKNVHISMRPRFIALFAFAFALSMGVIWEIFEFAMDGLFGANMQKPMLGDPSGLTDTMWDIIVDAIGALAVATLGWWHMHWKKQSFIDDWIHKFIERNPDRFRG